MKPILNLFVASTVVCGAFFAPSSIAEPLAKAVDLGNAFNQVSEKILPSVVVITNLQSPQSRYRSPYGNIPPELRFFFGLPQQPTPRSNRPQAVGRGSGVIFAEAGYIVTNYHVIKDADHLEVKLNDGKTFSNVNDKDQVKVVGIDESSDLAVLKIESDDELTVASFADSDQVKVGEWAIAVGAPFNLDYSVTVGVVSQKGRHNSEISRFADYIQTDASINPGNSGGPLLNIHGEVIGINNFIYTGGAGSQGSIGLGFAIASNLVKRVSLDLMDDGKIDRPWLGIMMEEMTPELREQLDIEEGVFVSQVLKDEPADEAGLKAGDIVLKVGNKKVNTIHELQMAVVTYQVGDEIPLTIQRDDDIEVIKVEATRRNEDGLGSGALANAETTIEEDFGMVLEETDDGLQIRNVRQNSLAQIAGLRRNDLIVSINRHSVDSLDEFAELIEDAKEANASEALILLNRRGRLRYTTLRLP